MVIDVHTHCYPDEVLNDVTSWATLYKERYWKKLVSGSPGKPSLQGWANEEKMLKDMQSGSINQCVLLGWYWENQETCALLNDWHSKLYQKNPHRFIPFAAVQPAAGVSAFEELKRVFDLGFKGIGELCPAVQGFSVKEPNFRKIVQWAIEKNMPINFHVTEPLGRPYWGRVETPLHDYLWLAQTFPQLKIILSHWGGLLPFYKLNPFVKKYLSNVYYDTAASPLLYEIKIFRSVIDSIGVEKILFGSDYPLRLYPKNQFQPNFIDFVNNIKQNANLTEDELRKIFADNFLTLLAK